MKVGIYIISSIITKMNLDNYPQKTKNLRKVTLCFLVKGDEVLLAMKKRGFGVGRWNGVGGKKNKKETIKQAAIREAKEEVGVNIKTLEKVATLDFYFAPNKDFDQQVIVFLVKAWEGEPKESEEMAPKWFKKNKLPFKKMWPDDIYWLPKVLNGKILNAEFLFAEGDVLLDYKVF